MNTPPRRFVFRPRTLDFFSTAHRPVFRPANDILAGVSVALIALPLALALGVASIPVGTETPFAAPALGVFTAILGGFLVSLLGGSRVQIGGPTAAFIPIVILIVSEHGYGGLLVATMMAGVILVLMGVARMGILIKYIPWPVTSGFTTGIAIAIIIGQLPDALGIRAETAAPREFGERMHWLFEHLPAIGWPSLIVAVVGLAVILLWSRFNRGWLRYLPGSMVVLVVATALTQLAGLGAGGGITTLASRFGEGALQLGLPAMVMPDLSWELVRNLIGPATAIALLGAIESLLSAVVADGLSGDRHRSNTELIAQGITNIVCPFFGGLPVTGAIARTSANVASGANTPIAGMTAAIAILLLVLLAAPMAAQVPIAAIAAVLIGVALRMGDWHEVGRLRKMPISDAMVFITTCSLTVVFDLVIAVEVGMVLSAVLFIKRVSETTEVARVGNQDMLIRPENVLLDRQIPDHTTIYRIFGPFLFGAAEKMEDALSRIDALPQVLILDLHLVTAMDLTGLNALESIVERMHRSHKHVIVSGIHHQPLQMLMKADFVSILGRENFTATLEDALKLAESRK